MKKVLFVAVLLITALSFGQPGGGGRGQRGFGGRNQNSLISLLSRSDVQNELKITDEQKTKIQEAMPQRGQRGAGQAGGQGGQRANVDPAEMRKQMAEREKTVTAILTADQAKRLKELFIQRVGNRAIAREDIQKELGLSDDQVKKVSELQSKQRDAQQAIMEKVRNGEIERTEIRALQQKNDKILNDELGKILTADQATKLKAMGGTAFKFDEDTNGRG